uniref:Uncharacterized protein n=1 Tax=Anguilla anguilla TaxID=7936 RepID=A0A0E9SK82_ANGAN
MIECHIGCAIRHPWSRLMSLYQTG